jgi:TRAP transporter TAXI family solute receptor
MRKNRGSLKWVGLIIALVCAVPVGIWYFTKARPLQLIVIAGGHPAGQYDNLAKSLGECLNDMYHINFQVMNTRGSLDNADQLRGGAANLAVLQSNMLPNTGYSTLAPLFLDVVYIIARKNSDIKSIYDLDGRRIIPSPLGSGSRVVTDTILHLYGIEISEEDKNYKGEFIDIKNHNEFEAALVTTSIFNPKVRGLLASGEFKVVPIKDVDMLVTLYPSFVRYTIPQGLLAPSKAVPPQPTPSVAVTAILAARDDVSNTLVDQVMAALYAGKVRSRVRDFIALPKPEQWSLPHLHKRAKYHYEPLNMEKVQSLVETEEKIRSFLLAIAVGLYFFWKYWRQLRKENQIKLMRSMLDKYFEKLIDIEHRKMRTSDPASLCEMLNEVASNKLEAM